MAEVDLEEPRNQFVHFGDGSTVQFVRSANGIDSSGNAIRRFLLRPGKEVIFRYNLKVGEDLDEQGLCVRQYPESQIEDLDTDPNHTRILVMTDFNNRPTKLSKRYEHLTTKIEMLEKQNNSYRAMLVRLQEEMDLMTNSTREWMTRNVDIINEARRAAGKQSSPDDFYEDTEE